MRCLAEDLGPSGPACQDIWATTLEPGRWLLRRVNIQGARQPDIRRITPNWAIHLSGPDENRPLDAVVVVARRTKILRLVRLTEYPLRRIFAAGVATHGRGHPTQIHLFCRASPTS